MNKPFNVYTVSKHHHLDKCTSENNRGLNGKQKTIVEEAFKMGMRSAGEIVDYFRLKRSNFPIDGSIHDFSIDPEKKKLSN